MAPKSGPPLFASHPAGLCALHAFAKAASKEDDGDVSDLFDKALGMQWVIIEEIAPGRLQKKMHK